MAHRCTGWLRVIRMTEQAPWDEEDSDGWAPFLDGTADRPPLPFFDQAMEFVGTSGGKSRVAIDLGCGGGAETCVLLDRGWSVFAADRSPLRSEFFVTV